MTMRDLKLITQGGILATSMNMEDCKALFSGAHPRSYDAGQMIFAKGEPGHTVMLIETGRVEVSVTSLSGRKSVLAHMGPGEVLGEIAALDGGLRSADAIAAKAVSGLALSRQNLLAFVAARPNVAQAIITALCQKVRNASDMFMTQSVSEGGARLAQSLLRLFDLWGEAAPDGTLRLSEKFSQGEIGEFSGLARENVNRHVKVWVNQGVLVSDNRQLVLMDRAALEAAAGL